MESTVLDQEENENSLELKEFPTVMPIWKFLVLNIFSGGLYSIYWFYRIWRYINIVEKADYSSILRALFSVFFIFSMIKKISFHSSRAGVVSNLNANFIGISYIILSLSSLLPSVVMIAATILIPVLFIQVQQVLNQFGIKAGGKIKLSFSTGEIVITLAGLLLTIIAVTGELGIF